MAFCRKSKCSRETLAGRKQGEMCGTDETTCGFTSLLRSSLLEIHCSSARTRDYLTIAGQKSKPSGTWSKKQDNIILDIFLFCSLHNNSYGKTGPTVSLDFLWNTQIILQVFGAGEKPVTAGILLNDKPWKEHPDLWNKDDEQGLREGHWKLVRHHKRDLRRDAQVKVQPWKQQGGRSWLCLNRLQVVWGLPSISNFFTGK